MIINFQRAVIICLFMTFPLVFFNCKGVPKLPSKYADAKFTISNFLNGCYKRASGTDPIDFVVNYRVKILNPNAGTVGQPPYLVGDENNVNSPSGLPKQPLEVTIKIPTDAPFYVEFTVVGVNCARCASEKRDPGIQALCNEELIVGQGYKTGRPKWYAATTYPTSIQTNYSVTTFSQIENDANSCGCIVPF